MTAQVIHGEAWEDYTKSRALGSSALAAWGTMSLAQWSAEYLESDAYDDEPSTTAGAKEGGDYLDARITGNKPLDSFAVKPEGMSFSNKDGKAWRDLHTGKTLITEAQKREVDSAVPFVREALRVLAQGCEVSYQVTLRGEIAGLAVQTRPDCWIDTPDALEIPDIKYVGQIDKFDRDWVGGRYEIQSALAYSLARAAGITKRINARFLLVESGTENPRTQVVRIPQEVIVLAVARLEARCAEIIAVRDSGLGFVDVVDFRDIALPGWAMQRLEA